MASRYFGIERGAQAPSITEGSSTTSKKIEVVVDLTSSVTKMELVDLLKSLAEYIANTSTYPQS